MTITINIRFVLFLLTSIIFFIGCTIICRNSEGEFKHNVLMGLVGGIFTVVVPMLFFGGTCEGWW